MAEPTDFGRPFLRVMRGEETFDTGGAANQRRQMEALARSLDEGKTFAQAVAELQGTEPPPEEVNTRSDLERVRNQLRQELAKPEKEQDAEFLRRATAVVRAFEEAAGVPGAAEEFAPAAFEGQPVEGPLRNTQLAGEMAAMQFRHRVEDFTDTIRRPFMGEQEQTKLATRRRVERAAERLDLEAKARASGVDVQTLRGAEIVGGLAPDVLVSAAPGGIMTRTVGGSAARVGAESAIGALLGASTVDLAEDPLNAAALEGGLAFGFGLVSELPGLGVDFLRREIRAARNSDRNTRMTQIAEESGIDLTLAERTQSPAADVAERGVQGRPGGARDEFLNMRKEQVKRTMQGIVERLNPADLSPADIIKQTREAYDESISALATLSSEQFRNTVQPSANAIGAFIDRRGRIRGGNVVLRPQSLITELSTQLDTLRTQPLASGKGALGQLEQEIEALSRGDLDLGQVQRLLKDLSGRTKPSGLVIKDNTQASDILNDRDVQAALMQDIETAIQRGGPEAQALADLQAARRQFAADRADIDVFQHTAVDKLLGQIGDPTAPDFGAKVLAMETNQFKEMLDIVSEVNPDLGLAVRSVAFQELVDKSRRIDVQRSTVDDIATEIDVGDFLREINALPETKLRALTGTAIPEADMRHIRSALVALQAIGQGPSGNRAAAQSLKNAFEQYAINAASRDKGFVARLLAGELAPGVVERLLFTPEGQRALSTLGAPRVGRAEFAQSANFVINAMREDELQTAEIRKQRAQLRIREGANLRSL